MNQALKQQIADLADDHQRVITTYGECDGQDWIEYIENYYLRKPSHFAGIIKQADNLTPEVKAHTIDHIRIRLLARRRTRGRERRITLSYFAKDPNARKAETSRYRYGKQKKGRIWKQSKKTGKFVAFSKSEKEVLRRNAE